MRTVPLEKRVSGVNARTGWTTTVAWKTRKLASPSLTTRRTCGLLRTGTHAPTVCWRRIRLASRRLPATAARTGDTTFRPAARWYSATACSSITEVLLRPESPGHIAGSLSRNRWSMSSESDVTRRDFLRTAAKTTGAAGAFSGLTFLPRPERVFGANDRVRVAVCGLRNRGKDHLDAYARVPNVEVVALCDVDETLLDKRRGEVRGNPRTFVDVRRLLEDPTIDAISIATPNHWHALIAIWACQAGKDVYVEKPCSHNLWEGRQLVRAAEKYQRIVQHGTQSRSSGGWEKVVAQIATGKLGKLEVSRGLCYKPRASIGFQPITSPPGDMDFDIWTGPAPKHEFHTNLVHYNWHWFWDFGNGDIGNQGVHEMDKARWGIPNATLPKSVISFGGRFGYKDQGETPNTQIALMDFGDTQLVFEVRGLKTGKYHNQDIGNVYHLESGTFEGTKFVPKGEDKDVQLPGVAGKRGPGG